MMKPIILGFFIMLIGIAIGMLLGNWMLTAQICGVIGLICLGTAGLLNGSFVSGDRNRTNSSFDTKEDNIVKSKITNVRIDIGLPNIILAVIILIIISRS